MAWWESAPAPKRLAGAFPTIRDDVKPGLMKDEAFVSPGGCPSDDRIASMAGQLTATGVSDDGSAADAVAITTPIANRSSTIPPAGSRDFGGHILRGEGIDLRHVE